jgi:hypothetical protein
MKILMLFVLLLVAVRVFAPASKVLYIVQAEAIKPYERLAFAVGMVESHCDTLAYNPVEQATGYFQVRPIRLRDYNQRTGSHLKMKDMYNYAKAKRVFMYYARDGDLERIARSWNGSGKKTIEYWNKVKKFL